MRPSFLTLFLLGSIASLAAQASEQLSVPPNKVDAALTATRVRTQSAQFSAIEKAAWEDSRPAVPEGTDELLAAIRKGSLDEVKAALNAGALPNAADAHGERPLPLAVAGEYGEIVRLLLQRGAIPDAMGALGMTPLSLAAMAGNSGLVRMLLREGAQVDARSNNRASALHEAVRFDHPEVVRILLRAQPNPKNFDREGRHPLALAAAQGRMACLAALLDSGVTPDLPDKHRTTALSWARRNQQTEAERLLVERGASREAWPDFE